MSFNDEYLELRKKRKKEQEANVKNSVKAPLFVNKTAPLYNNDDIAPSFVPYPSEKKEQPKRQGERTWFQKGAVDDGVSWKNVGKTILGTVADVAEDIGAGVLGMGERIVDAGAYVAGGVGGLLGADDFKSDMEAFIKKDLYDENEIARQILSGLSSSAYTSGITWAGGSLGKPELETARQMREESRAYIDNEMEEDSVLGERADALVQSAGQLAAQFGLSAVGVPWFVTSGVTSFGGAAEEAFNSGASYGEAGASALISAGAEILTEKLFGGDLFVKKAGMDFATNALSRGISNKLLRTLAKYGIDVAGEGVEEVASEFISNLGTSLYKEESLGEILFNEEALDQYLESFVGGAVLGGGMSGVNVIKANNAGVDYASGLTANEQKVVDKVYKDRVAEETGKKKSDIYNEVIRDMEQGRISTDTIEEVLGGDTYKAYNDTVASEDSLSERLKFLGGKDRPTLAEQSEYAELKTKLDEMKKTSQRSELKSKLGEEVFGLVQNDRLMESYNERGRRSQAFEADLTKYDAKSQATIKKAVESGILNNTRRTHEFVDMIAKISADKGVLFDFTNNEKLKGSVFAVDGKAVNGYVTKDGVTLNIDSAKSLNSVVGHEITHVLEGTELYTALQSAVTEYAKTKGDYQGRYDSLSKLYEGVKDANVDAELTADLVGDYLFTDTDFINNLATNKNVFQKIYDEIKYLCKVATAGSKEARELEKVKRAFEKAYQESGKGAEGTKYALSDHDFPVDAEDVAKEHFGTTTKWSETGWLLRDGTQLDFSGRHWEKDPDNEIELGEAYYSGKRNVEHYEIAEAFPELHEFNKMEHRGEHLDRFLNRGNIRIVGKGIVAIEKMPTEEQFEKLRSYFRENIDRHIVVGVGVGGLDFHAGTNPSVIVEGIRDYFDHNRKHQSEVMQFHTKYSLSDSDGNQLTKEQSEYFKDSKVRDENGNLKVMYHGSQDAGFHVFNTRFSDDDTSFFFVDSNTGAKGYSGTSETYAPKAFKTAGDFNNFFKEINARGYEVREENGEFTLYDEGDEIITSESADEVYEEFRDYSGLGYGGANYKVYLNLTNPLEVDAQNNNWNELPAIDGSAETYEYIKIVNVGDAAGEVTIEYAMSGDSAPVTETVDLYERFDDGLATRLSDLSPGESVRDIPANPMTTREYAAYAKENGYDGVIFKNILDAGLYASGVERFTPTTVAIAFDSNQIKSVANEKPTSDPDIRYSLTDSDGKPIDSMRISTNELDTKYSLSHNGDIAKGQTDYIGKHKAYVTDEELAEAQRVTAAMVDVMMKYSNILPEDKIGKVLTKNGSYDRSVENTTICVRTLAYNEFVDKVQEELGRPLTQMESFLVSQKLYDIATEPQCLYCYVSLDRKAFNDMLLRYMTDRDTVIAKYNNSDKSPAAVEALYEEFLHGRKPTKEMRTRFDAWLGYVDDGVQLLSLADVATEDRQGVIKANGGILAEQLKDARKYAQSASWSKIQKNYVAYRDEILKLGDRVVKNLNEHYGLRWYSFSDYSAAFIVENMQQITDASIRGLKGLAYTKDTDFAEIFAPSGMNINISVFVNSDKDGNFFIDEKQSAKFEQAKALRERYPNVGIVATVTNDDALRWAASQEWSDVIIPFHIVRTGTDVAEYYKWLNYTSESADTIADKDMWNAYVDSLNLKSDGARKKVSKNIYPNEHKNDKSTYLALCESRGLTPRFVRFAGEDWYMKLVNETRLSADASATLKPIYDEAAAKASFQKFVDKGGYEGGWYHEGVDVDAEARAVADDVLAGKRANEVSYGRQDGFVPEDLIASRKTNRQHGRMSLSEQGEQLFAPIRSSDIYGKDIRLETAVPETVAPVVNAENAKTTPVVATPDEEEVAPVMDYDAEQFESLTDADAPPPRNRGRLYDIPEEPKMTLEERRAAKLKAVQTELAENRTNRLNAATDYNQEIARLQSQYDAKKNKNTKVAHDLLRRIERVKRIRDSVDADYAKRITDLEAREKLVRDGKPTTRQELHNGIVDDIKTEFKGRGYDFDKVLKGAKNLSTFATVDNTPQRVMEKALGYKEGQILSDITVNRVAQNETEGIKWLNDKIALIKQISKQYGIKPGSKESAAAQMYAEGFYVDENNDIISYGDAELAQDFTDANVRQNIKLLASDPRIRQIYDETLGSINESRTRNAYPEIPRLDNYFLHFRAMEDTFSKIGLPFNPNDIRAKDLPTDLNGVTADLKPGQPYFASAMHRTGKRTSFDLLGGLERYLSSAKNQIYHIDDIQTLRALRNYIADTYGQANGLEGLDTLTEEEAQERIAKVYGAHLSTFAKFLNEEANILAGKTSLIDRGLEGIIGRRGITFLDTVNKQVGSNMVGFNISSSLTNFLPVAQTFAKTNKADFVKAFAQTVASKVSRRSDSFAENSPVMIRRKGADRFYRTPWQKMADPGYALMGVVDDVSTELIARTKYNELVRNGMDSQKAHYETDKWVSRLMGDRSLGQQPQLYNSRMLGLITKFQLEVRNQLDSQFYDTIQEAKVSNEHIESELGRNAKTAAKVASTFAQLAVVQHLFGAAFESVAGYNPAFDIIEVLLTACGFDDDEESEDTVGDNIEQAFLALLEDLPYTSTFTGGRIPISSALPVEELVTGQDEWGNDKSRLETLGEIAPYYLLPGGYGQIKKSAQGLDMFSDDHPIAGSYTDSGNLRFPVDDTIGNRIQAGIFGQYASENARDYFDNERSPLKEKQIQEFIDVEMPIRDYWDYREGLNKQETLEDKFDYIADLDLSVEQKNILINNVVNRKTDVDMTRYDDFSSFEEFDFYSKNTEKYNFLQDNGVSWKEYTASEDAKEDYDNIYSWYKNNPEKVTVSKAITDNVVEYRKYTSAMNAFDAKDANGNTVSGLKKERVTEYINGLDLDYGQKIILYRSMYDSKEDCANYNSDIVDYLNSRDDISYEEMVTILKELGFEVSSNGTVSW